MAATLSFDSNSTPYDFHKSLESLQQNLSRFNLTPNQSKVYVYLGKTGPKTAPEISKILKLPRTETYHLLNTLQNKGIVTATFEHPIRFEALPLDTSISILVNHEKDRVMELETQTNDLLRMWENTPSFCVNDKTKEDRFQIIKGKSPIDGKLKNMFETVKEEVLILGAEKDFMKFYHSNSFSYLTKISAQIKILSSCSDKTMYIFDHIPKEKVRQFKQKNDENLCFIIKDDAEVLFFIKDASHATIDMIAIWTDSKTLISSLKLLFGLIWNKLNSNQADDFSLVDMLNYDFKHRMNELEQEKLLISVLQSSLTKTKSLR